MRKRVYVPLKIIPKGSHITDKSTFKEGFNLEKMFIILTRHQALCELWSTPDILAQVQSWLHPLHAEVETEGDGVILVIDGQNIRNLKACQ